MMASILTVDDESGIRAFLADTLTEAGHEVEEAADGVEALRKLQDRPFDLAIFDLRMPGEIGGMDLVRTARAEYPDMQVLVLTAYGTIGTAVEAIRLGAFDFLEKPLPGPADLRRLVTRALAWRVSPGSRRAAEVAAVPHTVPEPKGRLARLSHELKRRHVYRVAVTYAAAAFIILQAGELVMPVLPLPDWAYPALVGLVVAAFPIALILGWFYDVKVSRGGKLTLKADREDS